MTKSVFDQIIVGRGVMVSVRDKKEFVTGPNPIGWVKLPKKINGDDVWLIYEYQGVLQKSSRKTVLSYRFGEEFDNIPGYYGYLDSLRDSLKTPMKNIFGDLASKHPWETIKFLVNGELQFPDPKPGMSDFYNEARNDDIEAIKGWFEVSKEMMKQSERFHVHMLAQNQYIESFFALENQIFISI